MDVYRLAEALKRTKEALKRKIEEEKSAQGTSIRVRKNSSAQPLHIVIDDFELLKILGEGGFGKVFLARYRRSGEFYALKAVKKSVIIGNQDYEITKSERNVLALGKHCPFITKLFCSFHIPSKLIFVMEFLSGGDLYYHLDRVKQIYVTYLKLLIEGRQIF